MTGYLWLPQGNHKTIILLKTCEASTIWYSNHSPLNSYKSTFLSIFFLLILIWSNLARGSGLSTWSQKLSNTIFINFMKSLVFVRIFSLTSSTICFPSPLYWWTCYRQNKVLTCWAGRNSVVKKKMKFGSSVHTEGVSVSPSSVPVIAVGGRSLGGGEGPCPLSCCLSRGSHGTVWDGGDFSSAELAGSLAFTRFPSSMDSGTPWGLLEEREREICQRPAASLVNGSTPGVKILLPASWEFLNS